MEALKVSYPTIQSDLEEAMPKNKSYQATLRNLQETLANKKEMQNRQSHLEHENKMKQDLSRVVPS